MALHKPTIEARFWKYVHKTETCWLWTGPIRNLGYGYLSHYPTRIKRYATHRLSWELHYGTIPEGLCVCHKCDVRNYVRPDHLFLGTLADNVKDAANKGRLIRGTFHYCNKLSEESVRTIRRLYPSRSQGSLAKEYGVTREMIRDIVVRRAWKWLPD